jgi:hypothetical protein
MRNANRDCNKKIFPKEESENNNKSLKIEVKIERKETTKDINGDWFAA